MKQTGLIMLVLLVPVFILAEEDIWKTELGLSYVNTSGNTEAETFSGKLAVNGAGWGNRYVLGGSYMYGKNREIESVNKLNADARAERVILGRLFLFIGASYLQDKYSGYNSRMALGPGLGMDILKQETQTLKGLVSSMYYFDNYAIRGLESEKYATGKAGLTYDWKIKEHVSLKAIGDYMLSLEETDRYFLTGDLSIQVGINSRIALGFGYLINYQNTPPDPALKKTDGSFLSSVVVNW